MRDKKGFTLVEVIISIGVLGILCAVLLRLFVMAADTNKQAGAAQSAHVCAVSSAEVLLSAAGLDEALDALGVRREDAAGRGTFRFEQGGHTLVIGLREKQGGYPGALYDISVEAFDGDRLLAAVNTQKYYKERRG